MSANRSVSETMGLPLATVPDSVVSHLVELGADEGVVRDSALYQVLANQPEVLAAWLEVPWRLRHSSKTPRRLHEIMIVRGAQLCGCEYELRHHEELALRHGVSAAELAEIATWTESSLFTAAERAALALMEAIVSGHVPDPIILLLSNYFGDDERVELTAVASFYCAVPRLIDALRIPLEERYRQADNVTGPE
jgi:AhpD family alkylhydroperoxidase